MSARAARATRARKAVQRTLDAEAYPFRVAVSRRLLDALAAGTVSQDGAVESVRELRAALERVR